MLRAYGERLAADRKWEHEKLRFIAAALGASVPNEAPDPRLRRDQASPSRKSAADVIRSLGGQVTTVKH